MKCQNDLMAFRIKEKEIISHEIFVCQFARFMLAAVSVNLLHEVWTNAVKTTWDLPIKSFYSNKQYGSIRYIMDTISFGNIK